MMRFYLLTLPSVAKWDADLAFLHALRSQSVPAFLSTVLYFAVRLKRRPPDAGALASTPSSLSSSDREEGAAQQRSPS